VKELGSVNSLVKNTEADNSGKVSRTNAGRKTKPMNKEEKRVYELRKSGNKPREIDRMINKPEGTAALIIDRLRHRKDS
jgi:hypothetical protein